MPTSGILMPEVGIFPAYEANAFATGWNKNDALVAVSQSPLVRFASLAVQSYLPHGAGHAVQPYLVPLRVIQGLG